jgi:hypothetical protein
MNEWQTLLAVSACLTSFRLGPLVLRPIGGVCLRYTAVGSARVGLFDGR